MDVITGNLPFLLRGQFPAGPLGGLALTIYLSILVGFLSFGIGTTLAAAELAPFSLVRWAVRALSSLVRGAPSVAFLFWTYFLLPRLLHVDLSPLESASIALALYHGAYMGEDIRGGINAVPGGQWEAARASGLNFPMMLRHVVLPQAIRAVVPALVNRFVNLFMYTSVVSMLGVLDFTQCAVLVNDRDLSHPIEIFGFVGFVYFIFSYGISRLGRHLEKKWDWAPKVKGMQIAA
ncbi:MAG TPA: amino acid ABC transporter permease [Alphaproteobacteria bacterium]|nr:amino acid ABC transporter permease [Alphaproteobacteria bacterium]